MRNQLFTAVALGFGLAVNPVPSAAGDLYYPADPGPQYQYDDRGSYGGSLKDPPLNQGRYDERLYEPSRNYQSGKPKRHARYYRDRGNYCLPRRAIRRQLRQQGYYDIRRRKIRPHIIKFRAWHDDGCLYRIHVDRCSGAVVRSRVLARGGGPRSYARGYAGPYRESYSRRYRRNYRLY